MNKTKLTVEETFNLAFKYHQKNNFKDAEKLYNEILEINPDHFKSIFLLGTLLAQSNQFERAKKLLYQAIRIQPDNADANNNLGNVLKELKEYQNAINYYKKTIEINPNFFQAYGNLGIVTKELGENNKSINYIRKAIEIQPNYAEAYNTLGVLLKESGEYAEAINCLRKAIKIQPQYAEAHNNLGVILKDSMQYEEAINCYIKAIQIQPYYAEANYNLGNLSSLLGKFDEATLKYHQAIKIKPDYARAYSNLLFNLNYKTDFDPNFYLSEAKKFRENCKPKKKLSFHYQYEKKPKKLKLGLVSADFGNHPGGYFTLNTLTELKNKNFDLIAYSNFDRKDEYYNYFKPLFSQWHLIEKKTDEEVVEQIFKDGIHILMDLQGHSAKNRLSLFMHKAAPIQASWLGQGTTGIPEIDYFVGSPHITPKSEDNHYVEEVWRLPEISQCFTPPDFDLKINNLPVLKNNFITFGCVNKLAKISDGTVSLWSKILQNIPNSKLLLKNKDFNNKKIVENTFSRFATHGVDKNKLILKGESPTRKELLEVYSEIDIALDPFPFQGNTTTCEAIWMGVPVLTLKGDRHLFHFGESINSNLGMKDWIAENKEEYISKAKNFSSNLAQLSKFRKNLRQTALKSPVFDAPRFAEHFSEMLWKMWERFDI